jgi:xanthine dehydrogenase accessory factor
VTDRHRSRLHGPVGLDIGADTPEEIALSIVAEIQAVRAGRSGESLRERHDPLHLRPAALIPETPREYASCTVPV